MKPTLDNKRGVCRSTTGNSQLPTTDLQSKSSVVKRTKCAAGNLLLLSFLFTKFSRVKFVERKCSSITYKIPSSMWCNGSTRHLGCWGDVQIVHIRPYKAHTATIFNASVLGTEILKVPCLYRSGGAMVAFQVHTLRTRFESYGCIHSRQEDYQNSWKRWS